MTVQQIQSGVYTGTITARSVDEPSPADEITYTVAVEVFGQTIPFEGVAPQEAARWSFYMPVGDSGEKPDLNPFPVGHLVPVHIRQIGSSLFVTIDRGECPAFGPCPPQNGGGG